MSLQLIKHESNRSFEKSTVLSHLTAVPNRESEAVHDREHDDDGGSDGQQPAAEKNQLLAAGVAGFLVTDGVAKSNSLKIKTCCKFLF